MTVSGTSCRSHPALSRVVGKGTGYAWQDSDAAAVCASAAGVELASHSLVGASADACDVMFGVTRLWHVCLRSGMLLRLALETT